MKTIRKILSRIWEDVRQYGWTVVIFLLYYLVTRSFFGAFCPQLIVAGIPCAGCGLTRAGLCALSGQMGRAFYLNPSIFAVGLFLLHCGYYRYIKGSSIKGFRVTFVLLIVCILVIYGYRMYCFFPDRVPYVYKRNNLLSQRFPEYGRLMDALIHRIRNWRM